MIENIVLLVNLLMGMIVAYENVIFYRQFGRQYSRRWIVLWYILIGLMWSMISLTSLLDLRIENVQVWHVVVIRPTITITLAVMAGNAIMRKKIYRKGRG